MLYAGLNAVFALIFGMYAKNNIPKGYQFLLLGWNLLSLNAAKADVRTNVQHRRAVSEGGRFFIGGLFWLITGMVSAVSAVIFTVLAFNYGVYNFLGV